MARIARIVIPDCPHLITQRGNRHQTIFFYDEDYLAYIKLMAEWCRNCRVDIWAWCLLPTHVHLIAVPQSADGLARAVGEAHRRYTRRINAREKWRGHLWQDRFSSFPMDEQSLLVATRYVEMSPVAADLVYRPDEYRWSSARAHLQKKDDKLVKVAPLSGVVESWSNFLTAATPEEQDLLKRHERTGRPLGDNVFIDDLEQRLGRYLRPQKPGPKKKAM